MSIGLRINLGSGQRPFIGWVNVDSQEKWLPDVCSDGGVYLRGLSAGEAEMICLHHVLEHFGCGEADGLLAECYRVLRPGGSLLVFVPDLAELARMWIEGRMTDETYLINIYGAFMGDEADRHKFGFTHKTLHHTLRRAGFGVGLIKKFNWRMIAGADIAQDRWILGLEAIR